MTSIPIPGDCGVRSGSKGLAPYFFQFAPTFYFSDRGYFAGRITGSYDLLITNRLILQPQIEMNFYSKRQPNRGVGSGLAEIDTGLRLRYEITRKFAPTSDSPTPELWPDRKLHARGRRQHQRPALRLRRPNLVLAPAQENSSIASLDVPLRLVITR